MKPSPPSVVSEPTPHGTNERTADASRAPPSSVLGPTVILKGELSFKESLVVQGQIYGSATGTSSVLIAKSARLSGVLSAEFIQVQQGAPLGNVVLTGCIQNISGKK